MVANLPTDGTPADRWLDRAVAAPLLANIQPAPASLVLDVADADRPVLRVAAGKHE